MLLFADTLPPPETLADADQNGTLTPDHDKDDPMAIATLFSVQPPEALRRSFKVVLLENGTVYGGHESLPPCLPPGVCVFVLFTVENIGTATEVRVHIGRGPCLPHARVANMRRRHVPACKQGFRVNVVDLLVDSCRTVLGDTPAYKRLWLLSRLLPGRFASSVGDRELLWEQQHVGDHTLVSHLLPTAAFSQALKHHVQCLLYLSDDAMQPTLGCLPA